jgi:hypothetical protein
MELWRLVLGKVATWAELSSPAWSMDDADRANAALDMKMAVEEAMMPDPPKENNK